VAQFGLLYVGEPQFDDPDEAQAHQKCWFDWIGSLAYADQGTPFVIGQIHVIDAVGCALLHPCLTIGTAHELNGSVSRQ